MNDEPIIEPGAAGDAPADTGADDAAKDAAADASAADKPADKAAATTAKWSDTWREDMAGALPDGATPEQVAEHEKLVKRLQRLNTPADVAKAMREQDKLISSGALKKALPKNATPEQVADWRKSNGIPEAPEKYDLGIAPNVALTDLDTEMLSDWAKKAHAANAAPDVVKAGAAAYLEMRDRVSQQIEERNKAAKDETTEALRTEWGVDYRSNVDGVNSLLRASDSKAVADLLAATTEDGVQLLNNPDVMRWLAGHARVLGYVGATVVPAGGDLGKSIDDEIAAIEAGMFDSNGAKSAAYWNNQKAQARYSELLTARERHANLRK
jgi:hypothetical protein